MSHRPHLVRNIPFWGIVVVSVATASAGALIVSDTLGSMTATLMNNTATGVDVYVGQSLAVLGAILLGAGILGVVLALTVAAIASLRPTHPTEGVESIDAVATDRDLDVAANPGAPAPVELAPADAAPALDTDTEVSAPTR